MERNNNSEDMSVLLSYWNNYNTIYIAKGSQNQNEGPLLYSHKELQKQ